jgi:tRNA threonylcarbamoyladenosine biosynthesis protein TsaE
MQLTYSIKELPDVAGKVLSEVTNKTLLFYGDMGVGKTTLIKELAKHLGVKGTLNSPTFSLINEHEANDDILYHFDFYRVNNEEEILDIGIEDYLAAGHWNFIEWPQKAERFLPVEKTTIKLTKNQNGSRTLNMMPVK